MWIRGSKPPSNKNGFAIFLGAVAVGSKGGLMAPGAVGEPRRETKTGNQDGEQRRGTKTGPKLSENIPKITKKNLQIQKNKLTNSKK